MQAVDSLKRVKIAFQALLVIAIIGTAGFMYLEKYTLLEAAWMTITTISTVGYGNFIPKTVEGELFTLILIIVGVGVSAYTLGELVGVIVEGRLQDALGRRQMNRRIVHLTNHTIVCGAGRIGENVIERLKREKVSFVVVEKDERVAQRLGEEGILVIQGDAAEDGILEQAGIKRAKGLITALSSDADNVFVTLSSKGLNPNLFIVARADHKESEPKLKRAGADRVISPAVIGGIKMASVVLKPFVTEFVDTVLNENEVPLEIEEIRIDHSSVLAGLELKNSGIKERTGTLIVAIRRENQLLANPSVEETLLVNDSLIAIGSSEQLEKLEQLAGIKGKNEE